MHVCVRYVVDTKRTKKKLLYMQSVFGRWVSNPRHPGDPVAGTCGSGDQMENREMGNGTSRCALCPQGVDPRAVSRSPTAKAEVRGEERKKGVRVHERDTKARFVGEEGKETRRESQNGVIGL